MKLETYQSPGAIGWPIALLVLILCAVALWFGKGGASSQVFWLVLALARLL